MTSHCPGRGEVSFEIKGDNNFGRVRQDTKVGGLIIARGGKNSKLDGNKNVPQPRYAFPASSRCSWEAICDSSGCFPDAALCNIGRDRRGRSTPRLPYEPDLYSRVIEPLLFPVAAPPDLA